MQCGHLLDPTGRKLPNPL